MCNRRCRQSQAGCRPAGSSGTGPAAASPGSPLSARSRSGRCPARCPPSGRAIPRRPGAVTQASARYLHARSARVHASVQHGQQHSPPVEIGETREEGSGACLLLGQEALEREGLLSSGRHGGRADGAASQRAIGMGHGACACALAQEGKHPLEAYGGGETRLKQPIGARELERAGRHSQSESRPSPRAGAVVLK